MRTFFAVVVFGILAVLVGQAVTHVAHAGWDRVTATVEAR